MLLSVLDRDELWKLLVEAVHALPMYRSHKRYVEDKHDQGDSSDHASRALCSVEHSNGGSDRDP